MLWGSLPESQCHHPFMDLANVNSIALPIQPSTVREAAGFALTFGAYDPPRAIPHRPLTSFY